MKAIHLQTEYLTEPVGIDITKPRFYWNCDGGIKQTAYRIIVRNEDEVLWDSKKTLSSSMTHIPYGGRALRSRERITWSVCLWDETDQPGEEVSAHFEMGLLKQEDWKAGWISGNVKPQKHKRYPVDCFRKTFRAEKKVHRARLYITACGLYEARLNGTRVGEFCLAPGCTDYRKRIQYQVYDITKMLRSDNNLEIMLADGWYRGSVGCFGKTNVYGRRTKLLCQAEIYYEDGSSQFVISDESFSWSNDGPIRFADLKDGEVYDASLTPSYRGKAVVVREAVVPSASNNVIPKRQERFHAKLLITPKGNRVLDFGQNLAGFLSCRFHGRKGQRLRLYFGEMLDEAGEFTQHNIHKHHKPAKEYGTITELLLMLGMEDKVHGEMQPTPKQELTLLCSGNQDTYEMAFSVFGFRYVMVETDIAFTEQDFEAIAVYSDLEETGAFSCSNPLVNQLVSNTRWSMKGNFLDIPTDCPTRERLGWLGEGQTFFETANYFMSGAAFYRKWLMDIRDAQKKDGKVSAVVPYVGFEMLYGNNGSSVGWADAMVLIPYRYFKCYQDERILLDCYEMMTRYAEFMIAHTGQKDRKAAGENPYDRYTYEKGVQLGEWLEPSEFQDTENASGAKLTLQTEVCTAYLHYTMSCMAEIARHLGKKEDAVRYQAYADGAKKAYHWLYLQQGAPDTDRQAKLVRPLALGLVDDDLKRTVQERLTQAVKNRDYRIGTGFLSTPFVLHMLTEAGHAEAAYRMLENEQAPGWLYEVIQGATTMWEDWEGTEYASRNHYAMGAVCQWLFDTVAGIRVDAENHFQIIPVPGGSFTYAEAVYHSIYGEVRSGWQKIERGVEFTVTLPVNTTAEIVLPDGERRRLEAGAYSFIKKEI